MLKYMRWSLLLEESDADEKSNPHVRWQNRRYPDLPNPKKLLFELHLEKMAGGPGGQLRWEGMELWSWKLMLNAEKS